MEDIYGKIAKYLGVTREVAQAMHVPYNYPEATYTKEEVDAIWGSLLGPQDFDPPIPYPLSKGESQELGATLGPNYEPLPK